ncbi:uncharacterized protein LY89DRAFT_790538 [Mollisia scopiformis]|uniref:BTB domain-containing protein n=1 Tax=Mollisia scopiformis TaxID=149040 RepID=A0A132B1W4_MOLSC|nr:uncharacterized protein LY89DRAFT_790538 [Mollisia scopiformis]KUJ06370.1 hypothetical protein LY89DRAFT_790538 [Mollisia scopiformis]
MSSSTHNSDENLPSAGDHETDSSGMASSSQTAQAEAPPSADEPQAAAPDPTLDFTFDTGNIRLLIKRNGQVVEGKASSDALYLASPVWKKFLFPPWQTDEELRHSVKQIDCTGNDSEALLILLNIAHLKFHKVPEHLGYETLLNIATLCDQYDCIHLLRPWLVHNLWLQGEEDASNLSFKKGQYGWLFIAWVFGREKIFEDLAVQMVTTIRINANQAWRTFTPLPPNIIESILSCRIKVIASLLQIPYQVLDRYEVIYRGNSLSRRRKNTICAEKKSTNCCDAIVYGSVVLGLQSVGLFPRKLPQDLSRSIVQLSHELRMVDIHHLERGSHYDCGTDDFMESVDDALTRIWNPVLDSHRVHMRGQNERLHR